MISIWKKRLSKSGKPYYKNTLTNESKWKVPNKNGILREFEESNNTFIIYIPDVYLNVKKKNSESLEFSPTKINIDRKYIHGDQTDGDCIKELIEGAYDIYSSILRLPYETTIICGGQSPAYYCLAMMNFSVYNDQKSNIIILPHSKASQQTTYDKVYMENMKYCDRLKEKGIELKNNIIIIDSIHSGVGILALESALKHCYPHIKVSKYSINDDHHMTDVRKYNFRCQAIFSDYFPRIVNSYPAQNFDDSTNFITNFINLDNPIAEMIVDIARNYPYIKVEDTEWYQLNNIITPEIEAARIKYKIQQEKLKQYQLEKEDSIRVAKETALASSKTFEPIKIINRYGSYVYQCPICNNQYDTKLVLQDKWECQHAWNCPNQYRENIRPLDFQKDILSVAPEPMMHSLLAQTIQGWGPTAPTTGEWNRRPQQWGDLSMG